MQMELNARFIVQCMVVFSSRVPEGSGSFREMFKSFIDQELAEVLLFFRHLTDIKLSEIGEDGAEVVMGRAWIENAEAVSEPPCELKSQVAGAVPSVSPYT